MTLRRRASRLVAGLLLLAGSGLACASDARTAFNLGHFNGLAMNGYDVMTYWRGGDPQRGNEAFRHDYAGASWIFVSAANRDAFAASPQKFAPEYGGYCAYAAAQGSLADVDPYAWRIWNDRLYLNYSPQVRRIWASDIDTNIAKGDANWASLDPARK